MKRNLLQLEASSRAEPPVSVAYVLGAPRSGSTLLDTILAAHPAVQGTGELCHVAGNAWINNEFCACGERANQCPLWSEVRHEWARRAGTDDVHAYREIVRKVEQSRRWMLQLPWPRYQTSELFQTYARQTLALFEAIRTVSGKPVVVDSSKRRSRAYALSLIPGIDLRAIHLLRDARGFAWSTKKRLPKDERGGVVQEIKPMSTWHTAIGWIVTNLQSSWVRRQLAPERSITIRYEDLSSDPSASLVRIGKLLQLDFDDVIRAVTNDAPVEIGHTVAGNRMRMSGRVRFRPDMEWHRMLSAADQRCCWAITGWLMRRYGYEKRPSNPTLPSSSISTTANGISDRSRAA